MCSPVLRVLGILVLALPFVLVTEVRAGDGGVRGESKFSAAAGPAAAAEAIVLRAAPRGTGRVLPETFEERSDEPEVRAGPATGCAYGFFVALLVLLGLGGVLLIARGISWKPRPRPAKSSPPSDPLETLHSSSDPVLFDLIRSELERAEIDVVELGGANAANIGAAGFALPSSIAVPSSRMPEAKRVLEETLKLVGQSSPEDPACSPLHDVDATAAETADSSFVAPHDVDDEDEAGARDLSPAPDSRAYLPSGPHPEGTLGRQLRDPNDGAMEWVEGEEEDEGEAGLAREGEEADDLFSRSHDSFWRPAGVVFGLQALLATIAFRQLLVGAAERDIDTLMALGALNGWPSVLEAYRLMTANFLHFDPFHLISNLIVISVFGYAATRIFGIGQVALTYVAACLATSVAILALHDFYDPPGHWQGLARGASGCAFALFGLWLTGRVGLIQRLPPPHGPAKMRVAGISLLVLFSIFGGSFPGHLGGLLCGLLFGVICRPVPVGEKDEGFERWSALCVKLSGGAVLIAFLWLLLHGAIVALAGGR